MDYDEHPREVTLEALAKLPPVFKKDGTVTAANASVSMWLPLVYRSTPTGVSGISNVYYYWTWHTLYVCGRPRHFVQRSKKRGKNVHT